MEIKLLENDIFFSWTPWTWLARYFLKTNIVHYLNWIVTQMEITVLTKVTKKKVFNCSMPTTIFITQCCVKFHVYKKSTFSSNPVAFSEDLSFMIWLYFLLWQVFQINDSLAGFVPIFAPNTREFRVMYQPCPQILQRFTDIFTASYTYLQRIFSSISEIKQSMGDAGASLFS